MISGGRRLSYLFSCRLFPNPTKRNASQADKRRTDGRGGGGSGEALISEGDRACLGSQIGRVSEAQVRTSVRLLLVDPLFPAE